MPLVSRCSNRPDRGPAHRRVRALPVTALLSLAAALAAAMAAAGWLTAPLEMARAEEGAQAAAPSHVPAGDEDLRALLDAPLLFVKRHSYTGIHIYDTYYKWPPGGGGIYLLENPAAPRSDWRIRPIIDPATAETLGEGVYSYPHLSFDATRLLFCFKGEPQGSTSIYEIGVDGRGLRRLSDPTPYCEDYAGSLSGQHDVAPAYLPDGRIVFLSTRPSGLVPCNNTGVAILHVMQADGSDVRPLSVNNVNEFDPSVLHDGRILFGRWEYIDKNALTIQSLWTIHPDGTEETALFANNMVFPEAILDAQAVPGSHLIVGTFAKHNAPPRGTIAMIDPHRGKNGAQAIYNFEYPDQPTRDTGNSCEPYALSEDVVLFSGRPEGRERNVIEMIDRSGRRIVLLEDAEICLHSPMLVRPRPRPPVLPSLIERGKTAGRFLVQDVYQGLDGVARGEVTHLRVIEETSRTSARSPDGNPFNQTFLISAALGWSAKNYLGVVPVEADGSAYFEVPAGRAIYLQALDAEGRLVQSMRTFVQAAPGATRGCIGCHEHKADAPPVGDFPLALTREPTTPAPERWGSGLIDYPGMIQPILDRHCAECHGGKKGFGAGLDLTGGWTEHFSISYENLVSRRRTQLVADWIAGIDCMNGTAFYSAQIFPPRGHGSGAAPLADVLVKKHPELSRAERDLLMAWIDTNGIYHGTWDTSRGGHATRGWTEARDALSAQMREAGCLRCHGQGGQPFYFESDWFNLQSPEMSRILRAPLAAGGEGFGAELCRDRAVDPRGQRVRLLRNGYAHAVQPVEAFAAEPLLPRDESGEPAISFRSTDDPHYQAMLAIIRQAQQKALASPRIDMPGAAVVPGSFRQYHPPPVPEAAPALAAEQDAHGMVRLSWRGSAAIAGRVAQLHRAAVPDFAPSRETLLAETTRTTYVDAAPPPGEQHYALVITDEVSASRPSRATIRVPLPPPPAPPIALMAEALPGEIALRWRGGDDPLAAYRVERAAAGSDRFEPLGEGTTPTALFIDRGLTPQTPYVYRVRAVDRFGRESGPSEAVSAAALPLVREPLFVAPLEKDLTAKLLDGSTVQGRLHGGARIADGALQLVAGGYATFPQRDELDLRHGFTVECRVRIDEAAQMPVVLSYGRYQGEGWFLQHFGGRWRWHLGGISCDGGRGAAGQWVHLAAVFDGREASLYQNGREAARVAARPNLGPSRQPLFVGQYGPAPGEPYQVLGQVRDVRVYHRALDPREIAERAAAP